MKLYNKAEEAANDILHAFENPNDLPKPLAQVFVHRKDNSPCRAWSWRNQIIVAIRGYSEARGYKQWQQVERQVMKGEKAFHILSPVTIREEDEEIGEKKVGVIGFKGTAVFGFEQTEGEPLMTGDSDTDSWFQSLPLLDVARSWGVSVALFNGAGTTCLGKYCHDPKGIALGVKNLSTWMHELVHAADHRNGKLKELGQHWRSETVAELGGAVLLRLLGLDHDADLGGCWEYIQRYAAKERIEVLDACGKVLERTCEAVALILDTAEEMQEQVHDSTLANAEVSHLACQPASCGQTTFVSEKHE